MNQSTVSRCNTGLTVYSTNSNLFEVRKNRGGKTTDIKFKLINERIGPFDFEPNDEPQPERFSNEIFFQAPVTEYWC